jgi:alpha-D-ribose 1-methylphosphonate 5-triphosphate synthase subunit PhnL
LIRDWEAAPGTFSAPPLFKVDTNVARGFIVKLKREGKREK